LDSAGLRLGFGSLEGIREVNDMRNILTTLYRATLLVIVSFGTLSGLGAEEKPGDLPVRKEIHRQYNLSPCVFKLHTEMLPGEFRSLLRRVN
jgi:hypothetical protein